MGIVYYDDEANDLSTRALFGRNLPELTNFLQNTVSNYCNTLNSGLSQMKESIYNSFNSFNNNFILNKIEAIKNRMDNVWHIEDRIKPLYDISQIQQAPYIMQRWIMANPFLQASFLRDGCSGYNGSYVNVIPDSPGKESYDYRRVTNGVVIDGSYTNYYEPLIKEDTVLNIIEKNSIMHTWKVIDKLFADGCNTDPTDSWSNGTIV